MKANKWKTNVASLREISDELANPGCGWYEIHSFWAERQVFPEEIRACISQEDCLVLVRIHLGAYANMPLDETACSNICNILSVFQKEKKDVILRCCYDFEGNGMEKEPASFSQVLVHMKQVAELVRMYDKVVYLYQGVLLGSWGEMHTSKFLVPERVKELADTFVRETKKRVWHAVRTPIYWKQITGTLDNEVREEESPFTIFDDGIFGSSTHLGTVETPSQLDFVKGLSTIAPYGGEVVHSVEAMNWSMQETITRLQQFHVCYLNRRHDEMLLRYWESQTMKTKGVWNGINGKEYIGRHLGYRFHIRKVEEVKRVSYAEEICLNMWLVNSGFSDVYEEVEIYIIYETSEGVVDVGSCQRQKGICPGGMETQLTWKLPRKPGNYYLAMHRAKDKRRMYFANPATEDGWVKLGAIV